MAEYIEREALLTDICNDMCGLKYTGVCENCRVVALIADTPAADVSRVVRCKDCKHYDMGVCLKIYSDGNVHSAAWQRRKPEDFCSYGERRDKPRCSRGQRGPLAVCPVCGGFDIIWNPDTDESICKSCGFGTGNGGGNAEG